MLRMRILEAPAIRDTVGPGGPCTWQTPRDGPAVVTPDQEQPMDRPLDGRRIVLGVTGGVAAYKAAELCRELVRRGAFVSPILTESAQRFIGAATFDAIASEPARTTLWDSPEPSPHTDLGQQADLVVVAPATANLLAAARAGTSHDLLTTTLLATRAPVLLCPAMHTEMWEHPATRENVQVLLDRGTLMMAPATGELAGGDVGTGRLADPIEIADRCEQLLSGEHVPVRSVVPPQPPRTADLAGLTVLVSAGGTREAIDPVRFIGNRSSGRQGHAIARAARARGARVLLVTTMPNERSLARSASSGDVCAVDTAQQLHDEMLARAREADVVVMCAAVADFRPVATATGKLKRRDGLPQLELEPTPNVLRALVAARPLGQTIVGFAAETDDVDDNALEKLAGSGADLLVANDVSRADAGFEHATNAVTIHRTGGAEPIDVPVADKLVVADRILDAVLEHRAGTTTGGRSGHLREVRP
jgi:phosphopantothenoylcysteine decarboxylase/phosphopantothenate--cysteine ligase